MKEQIMETKAQALYGTLKLKMAELETAKETLTKLTADRQPGEHGARRSIRRAEKELEAAQAAYNDAYKAYKAENSAAWAEYKNEKEDKKMNDTGLQKIDRYVVAESKTEEITIFSSAATRHIIEMGHAVRDSVVKIKSECKDTLAMDYAHAEMVHYCAKGFSKDGKRFVPLIVAASDHRKATATWMDDQIAAAYWKWSMCGLTLPEISGKIAVNKYMAYQGLMWSASKKFKEVFGIEIDPARIAVVKDGFVEVTGIMDVVHDDGTVEHAVERTITINAFDGQGSMRATLSSGESVTIRAPWMKAFVQACNWDEVIEYFTKVKGDTKIQTIYGEKDLQDIDIVLTVSCFKAAKLYDSWEKYEKAFRELGHEVCVCVREHQPKLKGMPYQQGQTLQGTDEDVEKFAQHSLMTVSKYENQKEAVKLLRGYHRAAAKLYPAMMKEGYTARTMQEKYTSLKMEMLGGRIPELGYNAFGAADIKAFWEHVAGQPIVGCLKAGECSLLLHKEGLTDVTRSPHLDNAHVLLYNVRKMPFVPEKSPTLFVNIWDLTTIQLRCDYDGDHFWYSQNANLLDLIKRTYEVLKNLPIDWEAPESTKGVINRTTISEFVSNLLKGSEIGLYADALTKMWANGYNHDVCCWLTYAGNVLIDAAKHGNVKIEKPDAVKAVDSMSLPEFCMYAKADKEHPAGSKYWTEERFVCVDEQKHKKTVYASEYNEKKHGTIKTVLKPRTQYSGSFLDKFSRRVKALVPDTLVVNGLDEEIFDVTVMLINPKRIIGKLAGLSKKASSYNDTTGKYEDEGGLFQQIAFRQSAEWKELINYDEFKLDYKAWEDAKAESARQEMIAWARAKYEGNAVVAGYSDEQILEGIYDIVTRNMFGPAKVSDGYDTVVKSAYWRIFGKMACDVIADNLGEEALSFDPRLDDDLGDVDGAEDC